MNDSAVVLKKATMDRLTEREAMILDTFSRQFEGRVNHSMHSWADLGIVLNAYIDSCVALEERRKRKKHSEPELQPINVNFVVEDLLRRLLAILHCPGFPISPIFEYKTLMWLSQQFEQLASERGLNRPTFPNHLSQEACELRDSKYAFKTYFVDETVKVTLLEENNNPMGNDDGATGLVTWQGAYCLYSYISSSPNVLPATAKVFLGNLCLSHINVSKK